MITLGALVIHWMYALNNCNWELHSDCSQSLHSMPDSFCEEWKQL